jgi:dTDP-4-amino-4,6-dideoxygalactose transaminase
MRPIKFVDLAAQNAEVMDDIERELAQIHDQCAYVGGTVVEAFEREFADFLGVRHAIGVGSGTDALRLALIAAGLGPGDQVVTTPMTFIATAAAIQQTGARPVFVDVDPETGNLSPRALQRYLECHANAGARLPRAIVPVHLYGLPAAMNEIMAIAREFGLTVIEDACQAHGARWRGPSGETVMAGTQGLAGCFSFYPGKNLGAWGEAGAVVTNDDQLAERVKFLRDHGRISHYAHREFGYNARLDAIQAAVLRAKLRRLGEWNERRRKVARLYRKLLGSTCLRLPAEPDGMVSANHLFVVRTPARDLLREALVRNEIQCGIHYPVPLHLQPACRQLGHSPGDFPVCETMADTVLSLPMHPHLSDTEVGRVAQVVRDALAGYRELLAGGLRQMATLSLLPPRRR